MTGHILRHTVHIQKVQVILGPHLLSHGFLPDFSPDRFRHFFILFKDTDGRVLEDQFVGTVIKNFKEKFDVHRPVLILGIYVYNTEKIILIASENCPQLSVQVFQIGALKEVNGYLDGIIIISTPIIW